MRQFSENVSYFLLELSAKSPQIFSKLFEQLGAILTKDRSHIYIFHRKAPHLAAAHNLHIDTPTEGHVARMLVMNRSYIKLFRPCAQVQKGFGIF